MNELYTFWKRQEWWWKVAVIVISIFIILDIITGNIVVLTFLISGLALGISLRNVQR